MAIRKIANLSALFYGISQKKRLFYKINDGFFVVSVCTTQKWQQIGSIRVSGIEWLTATFLFSIVEFQGADFLVSTCKMMIDSLFKNSLSVFSC